jgi:hypothetical protein
MSERKKRALISASLDEVLKPPSRREQVLDDVLKDYRPASKPGPLPGSESSSHDNLSSQDNPSSPDNLTPDDNLSSPVEIVIPSRDKSASPVNLSSHDKLSPDDINPGAWTGVPNDVWKKINCKLRPAEQAIFSYLYRQTRGFHRDEYRAAKAELARACMMSERNVPRITKKLASKGLVEILGHDIDNPDYSKRGTLYRMLIPGAAVKVKQGRGDKLSSGEILSSHSNKKDIKETSERVMSPSAEEIKLCPDCQGSGFWYPEGNEKGVAKCKHTNLASSERTSPT